MKLTENRRITGAGIYFIANLCNKAISFITIPIFTQMLTTSEYGIASTYVAYVGILQYFMGVSSEYTIRNAFVDYRKEIPRYMSSMYLMTTFFSAVVAAIVLLGNEYLLHITSLDICVYCLVQAFMTYILNAMSYKLMMEKSFLLRSIVLAGPNILSVIMGVIFISCRVENREIGRIHGYVVAYLAFGVFCLVYTWRKHKPTISVKLWKYILEISLPLVLHGISMFALSQLDRIMITSMRNESETGIYSVVYSMSTSITAVTGALEGTWTPWFTEKYKKREYNGISKRAGNDLWVTSVVSAFAMFVLPEVLKIVSPKEYWSGNTLIPPLIISVYIMHMYFFLMGLEMLEKKTKSLSLMSVLAMLLNLLLNYIFIPRYGAMAAAYTTMCSYLLLFVLHWLNVNRINKNVFSLKDYFLPSLLMVVCAIVFYCIMDFVLLRWGVAVIIGTVAITLLLKRVRPMIRREN